MEPAISDFNLVSQVLRVAFFSKCSNEPKGLGGIGENLTSVTGQSLDQECALILIDAAWNSWEGFFHGNEV